MEASSGPRPKGAPAHPGPWGPGWRRTRHSWGCFGARAGKVPGTVGAALGPGLEGGLAQLRPALGPDQREPRHSQALAAQDEAGPGTVGAALGPRMEEDRAQFGLLLGPELESGLAELRPPLGPDQKGPSYS